jgi:hypothetical protein
VAVSVLKHEEKRTLLEFRRKYEGNMTIYLKEIKCENVDWIIMA